MEPPGILPSPLPHQRPSYPRRRVSSTPQPWRFSYNGSGILVHPLEPVIGRRVAPTRRRVMTAVDGAVASVQALASSHHRLDAGQRRGEGAETGAADFKICGLV